MCRVVGSNVVKSRICLAPDDRWNAPCPVKQQLFRQIVSIQPESLVSNEAYFKRTYSLGHLASSIAISDVMQVDTKYATKTK